MIRPLHFIIAMGCLCVATLALHAEPKTSSAPPSQIRILCLGDSITQGDAENVSWRYWLWQKSVDAGWNLDFVGTLSDNWQGNPEWPEHRGKKFDRQHDARWGWTATKVADQLPTWLGPETVDVALLHLGTNDSLLGRTSPEIAADLNRIIETLQKAHPKIQIFLSLLIPCATPGVFDELNELLAKEAAGWSTPTSVVRIVDPRSGFDPKRMTYDGLHPNPDGEIHMADAWFDALKKADVESALQLKIKTQDKTP